MTNELTKAPIAERFQHLLAVISSKRFLEKQGLGNEIPFFICPYGPKKSVEKECVWLIMLGAKAVSNQPSVLSKDNQIKIQEP